MSEFKHEYQKYADSAVRGRAAEEGFGRLRLCIFVGAIGGLGIFLTHMIHYTPPRLLAMAFVGAAPLAVLLLIVNFIRLPNECKSTAQAIMVGFVTLLAAGGTIALANFFDIFKIISP